MDQSRVEPGSRVDLSAFDPRDRSAFDGKKLDGRQMIRQLNKRLATLQELLWAEHTLGAVVRRSRQPEVVSQPGGWHRAGGDAGGAGYALHPILIPGPNPLLGPLPVGLVGGAAFAVVGLALLVIPGVWKRRGAHRS